ncbi:MAG: cysteine--tRNA ligase, partial [bacterium]
MRIHNTLTRKMEEFVPLDGKNVRMYTCGPTVYDFAHIGNFRAYIFEDLLRRYLKFRGFQVTQVMNLTDVDDKTIKGALREKMSLDEYTRKFKDAFFADLKALNIEAAEVYPAATAHIPEMIVLISRLFDKGYAYRSDDGSIYFAIDKFKAYGKLAHIDTAGLRSGARVAQDEYDKENASDFALWKAWDESDGDVAWESPWGRGRPGWHLECSAMSMKYLGESFDLHTGGLDNMFPHHENEIAQSEAATDKPFVKYWMHCGYLVVNGKKMSKSLGNFYTVRDILGKGYNGREMRYILISAHYSQPLNFTFEALDGARSALARVDEFIARLTEKAGGTAGGAGQVPDWAENGKTQFIAALDEDLGSPEALGALFDMIHAGNRALDAGGISPESARAALAVLNDLDRVFDFMTKADEKPDSNLLGLVDERETARKARDWKTSDRLRDEIARLGWVVKDTPQ